MALEFVIVKFPTSRTVYVDGNRAGFTNTIIVIETGNHVFDLGKPANYDPEEHQETVQDTSVVDPLEIEFTRASA